MSCGVRVRFVSHLLTFRHHECSLYHLFIVWFGYVDNEDRNRMDALEELTIDKYRQDIISNNIGEWIIKGRSHFTFKDASVKPLCQNTELHPNDLEGWLMNPLTSYTPEGTHPFLTL